MQKCKSYFKLSLIFFILANFSFAQKNNQNNIKYFLPFLGIIHRNPSLHSSTLTTIACGFPLKILPAQPLMPGDFYYVQAGSSIGYVHVSTVSEVQPFCFQDQYPMFFNGLNLDLTELYYWGRLNDQFQVFQTRIP